MSRVVKVLVVDGNGYGVYGKEVYTYQNRDDKQYSGSDGECTVVLSTDYDDAIYVNGSEKWKGSASNCKNPLVVRV
jgi:hypothetical protein